MGRLLVFLSPPLCVLDGSPVSGDGARGPLMRETGVHLCGLNERREPTLSGLFKILWEKRNVLFPDSQRESDDAAWMRRGDEWDLLHNLFSKVSG